LGTPKKVSSTQNSLNASINKNRQVLLTKGSESVANSNFNKESIKLAKEDFIVDLDSEVVIKRNSNQLNQSKSSSATQDKKLFIGKEQETIEANALNILNKMSTNVDAELV